MGHSRDNSCHSENKNLSVVLSLSSSAHTPSEKALQRTFWRSISDRVWGYDFFISYHWMSGGTYAVQLAQTLRSKGFDVFLDRSEYASGDDLSSIGVIALANTQRLIIIATREAVTVSTWVRKEVQCFARSHRPIIPIIFGDAVESAMVTCNSTLSLLPDNVRYIDAGRNALVEGPSTDTVEEIIRTYNLTSRRRMRIRIVSTALFALTLLLFVAVVSLVATWYAKINETAAKDKAESQNAALLLANARRSIENDNDVGAGLLWYSKVLETPGDATIRERDLAQRIISGWCTTLPRMILPHEKVVTAMELSADGKTLVTGCNDNYARIWDTSTGVLRSEIKHKGAVSSVAISPDGTVVATRCNPYIWEEVHFWDDEVQLWNARTGAEIGASIRHKKTNEDSSITKMLFSADSQRLVTMSLDFAQLWDCGSGLPRSEKLMHDSGAHIYDVSFSPDGRTLISSGGDSSARLWDAKTGYERRRLHHPKDMRIRLMEIGRGGNLLATASSDDAGSRTVYLWDAESGVDLQKPLKHELYLSQLVFDSTEKRLATASCGELADQAEFRLYNLETNEPVGTPIKLPTKLLQIKFSPDGTELATLWGDSKVRMINAETGRIQSESVAMSKLSGIAFRCDGGLMASVSQSKEEIVLWDTASGQPAGHSLFHERGGQTAVDGTKGIVEVAFSPDGRTLVVSANDNCIRLFDTSSWQRENILLPADDYVESIQASDDGRFIAVAQSNLEWDAATLRFTYLHSSVSILDRFSGDLVGKTIPLNSSIRTLQFSPDCQRVAIGTQGGDIQLWSSITGKPISEANKLPGSIVESVFTVDGMFMAVLFKGVVQVLRCDHALEAILPVPIAHEHDIDSIAYCVADSAFVASSSDMVSRIFPRTGATVDNKLKMKGQGIRTALSGNGEMVAAASRNLVHVFNARTCQMVGRALHHVSSARIGALSPDGSLLVTVVDYGDVRNQVALLWETATGVLRCNMLCDMKRIRQVSFSGDGATVMVVGESGEVEGCKDLMMFETVKGHMLCDTIVASSSDRPIDFLPSGREMVSVENGGTVRISRLAPLLDVPATAIQLQIEYLTGRAINDGFVRGLDTKEWTERGMRSQNLRIHGDSEKSLLGE